MASHILDSFSSRALASPYAATLSLSLGMISYYFWGNVGSQCMGSIVFAIYPEERRKLEINTTKAVELFGWSYQQGLKHMATSAAVGGLAALVAAFQTPPPELSFSPRNYLLLLAPFHFASGAFTVMFMFPTNYRLLALRDKVTKARSVSDAGVPLSVAEQEEAEALLQKWKRLHYVRLAHGAMMWVTTLAVYMATV